jgi:hypothetical protein
MHRRRRTAGQDLLSCSGGLGEHPVCPQVPCPQVPVPRFPGFPRFPQVSKVTCVNSQHDKSLSSGILRPPRKQKPLKCDIIARDGYRAKQEVE